MKFHKVLLPSLVVAIMIPSLVHARQVTRECKWSLSVNTELVAEGRLKSTAGTVFLARREAKDNIFEELKRIYDRGNGSLLTKFLGKISVAEALIQINENSPYSISVSTTGETGCVGIKTYYY